MERTLMAGYRDTRVTNALPADRSVLLRFLLRFLVLVAYLGPKPRTLLHRAGGHLFHANRVVREIPKCLRGPLQLTASIQRATVRGCSARGIFESAASRPLIRPDANGQRIASQKRVEVCRLLACSPHELPRLLSCLCLVSASLFSFFFGFQLHSLCRCLLLTFPRRAYTHTCLSQFPLPHLRVYEGSCVITCASPGVGV